MTAELRLERWSEGGGGMFRVVRAPGSEAVGMVGYWERVWHDAAVYEAGWQVLTEYQGRGIAGAAVALLLDHAATHAASRAVHAFPSVDNTPSNALCRKLGFVWVGECDFDFPPGHQMRCNDWRWGPPVVT